MPSDVNFPSLSRIAKLALRLEHKDFRHSYLSRRLKTFLATQIRALRGDKSQEAFGREIGKPQSVVSRLESETYGRVNIQTLLDIAIKLDIALIVQFVDYETFLRMSLDYSREAIMPDKYDPKAIAMLASEASAAVAHDKRAANMRQQKIDLPRIGDFPSHSQSKAAASLAQEVSAGRQGVEDIQAYASAASKWDLSHNFLSVTQKAA